MSVAYCAQPIDRPWPSKSRPNPFTPSPRSSAASATPWSIPFRRPAVASVTPRLNEPWWLPGLGLSGAAAPLNAGWLWPRVVPAPPDVAAHIQAGGLQLTNIKDADSGLFAEAAE